MATYYDSRTGKIPNKIILLGYVLGSTSIICANGPPGFRILLIRAVIPIMSLYILFLIKALGAGDIKILSVVSIFLGGQFTISLILISFFIGAGISCHRILKNKDLIERLICFRLFITECLAKKRILKYSTLSKESSYLHFSICILLAYIYLLFRRKII